MQVRYRPPRSSCPIAKLSLLMFNFIDKFLRMVFIILIVFSRHPVPNQRSTHAFLGVVCVCMVVCMGVTLKLLVFAFSVILTPFGELAMQITSEFKIHEVSWTAFTEVYHYLKI